MSLFLVGVCLLAVVGAYFWNNPMKHGGWFMVRRLINWFPLGMTYAFLYMGRYNLNVAKNALGPLMTKEDLGIISGVGMWVYAASLFVNGPLVDRIGGRKGMLISAIGASVANAALGVLTYFVAAGRFHLNRVVAFSILYAVNMYFQSYGGVSIIKVKAYWFHVRERGVFGAIFGTLISIGTYFAFDWSDAIADFGKAGGSPAGAAVSAGAASASAGAASAGAGAASAGAGAASASAGAHSAAWTWGHSWVRGIFGDSSGLLDASWAVFFVPAAILVVWVLIDLWLIRDAPEDAGFPPFDTADASSGQMHVSLSAGQLLKKVLTSRLMLVVAFVNLTSGIYRNGIQQWYYIFKGEVPQTGAEIIANNWGLFVMFFGIIGSFAGGIVSDKFFQSRRGPPTAVLCLLTVVMSLVMAGALYRNALVVAISGLLMIMAAVGVTSLMAGTAATDFGGRKATATSTGIVDGCAYIGSGIQSVCLGYITSWNWHWWPLFITPWALIGAIFALRIWNELPPATRKYLAEVEKKALPAGVAAAQPHGAGS